MKQISAHHWTVSHKASSSFACLLIAALVCTPAHSSTLTFPVAPLFVANSVSPNVMLMLDSSGSMQNIVPEAPYSDAITYLASCPSGRTVPTTSNILAAVQATGSGTPKIFYDGNLYDWGTGGKQKCFDPTATYGGSSVNVFLNPDGTEDIDGTSYYFRASGYLGTSYSGNYLNWYFNPSSVPGVTWNGGQRLKPISATETVKSRITIVKDGSLGLADSLDSRLRVGLTIYNTSNVGGFYGGVLKNEVSPMGALGSPKRTALKSKIRGIGAGGATPLASTLSDIGHYFGQGYTGNLTIHPTTAPSTISAATLFSNHAIGADSGVPSTTDPIVLSCQRNFAILLTDGRPQNDQVISDAFADYDGDCTASNGCTSKLSPGFDKKSSRTYESAGSDYLDDVAQGLREIDLRPDFPDEATDGKQFINNVVTYMIGFADPAVQNDPLVKATADDTHGGGGFYPAVDSTSLNDIFAKISLNILKTGGSFSAVAANSTRLNTGTGLFQANFNSGDWSGDLLSFSVSTGVGDPCSAITKGLPCTSPNWRAATKIDAQGFTGTTAGDRVILTYDTGATRGGRSFRWASLSATQKATLNTDPAAAPVSDGNGSLRLDFLRGDRTHELASAVPSFRSRSTRLGDIVHSDPFFVGAPPQAYNFNSYADFRSSNKARRPMVYVGANDGMLHGFEASTGNEVLAYVPSKAYGSTAKPVLSKLTQENYTHQTIVDGSPVVGDAFIGGAWKSVLVGGMRAGGQSLYALDVTDPTDFRESKTSTVMWEFNDTDDADLGYTFSKPNIVKMANGKWAAIIGNGYNNTETDSSISGAGANSVAANAGKSAVFIIFLDGPPAGSGWRLGTDYIKLVTSAGSTLSPNGMATTTPVDINDDNMVDYIYSGDELGNLWRFDVNNTDPTSWAVGYSGAPLFKAKTGVGASAVTQPITVAPDVGFNRLLPDFANPTAPKLAIYFGTGRYIDVSDNTVTAQPNQTFYGIFDSFAATTPGFDRSNLLQQTILTEVTSSGSNCSTDLSLGCFRITSANAFTNVDGLLDGKKGWYIDLTNTALSVADNKGERQITNPVLRAGKIFFTTSIPSSNPCSPGGTGFLMELDATSGARFAKSKIDINKDGNITDTDNISITVAGVTTIYSVAGVRSTIGVLSSPTFLVVDDNSEEIYTEGSGGKFGRVRGAASGRLGRISWREIIQ